MAAVDYFLKIEGIDGESAHAKHKGEIDVESWSWGETQPGIAAPAEPGSGPGKVSMNDFMLHDAAEQGVAEALPRLRHGRAHQVGVDDRASGGRQGSGVLPEVVIRRPARLRVPRRRRRRRSSPGQRVVRFEKLEVEYKEQKPDGSLAPSIKAGWDVKANKKL